MNDDTRFIVGMIGLVLGVILIIGVIAAGVDRAACFSKWDRSGMAAEWGLLQGCVVEVEHGRWLPEDRVREIDIPRKK